VWRGEIASQAAGALARGHPWEGAVMERERRRGTLHFVQIGENTFLAAPESLGCSSKKPWGGGLA